MKLRLAFSARHQLGLHVALLGLAITALAASPPKHVSKPAKPGPAVTNAPAAEAEPPKSVFNVPSVAAEGKDPFFPRSQRPYGTVPIKPTKKPAAPVVELQLKGISGSAGN